jgi:uncharacterized protein
VAVVVLSLPALAHPRDALPELQGPVTDLADVIPPEIERQLDSLSRALRAASGDVVVVATVPTIRPYGDIREYAVRLFENRGRGIGQKGKDNGLLILLALDERRVWIEVGYGLEQWITDGFAGETSRDYMVPAFRNGRYGEGLLSGARRIVARIAEGRNVTLDGVEIARERPRPGGSPAVPILILILLAIVLLGRRRRGPRRHLRRWGRGGWSGWSSGVGPFGGAGWGGGVGGFGGGFGGFGGGFGGFGGGRSGGGGGGAGW